MQPTKVGPELEHWHFSQDNLGIVWLLADRADDKVNTLSFAMMEELNTALDAAVELKATGLALMSAKKNGFFHGADIREFDSFTDETEVERGLEKGHALFNKLAGLDMPTVAGIDGPCAGGGLELALACKYRIATSSPSTRLGLPEVKLGIFPGLGGTGRLTQLIGGKDAVPLMLTGKLVKASAARRLGIVDKVIKPHEEMSWAVRKALTKKHKSKGPSLVQKLSNSKPARMLLAPMMEKATAKKAREAHYPAPFQIIENWKENGGNLKGMLAAEKEKFPALMISDTARNLRRVFFMMERLKGFGKAVKDKNAKVRRVHVIGAGTMGADIAAWSALQGFEVTLQDLDQAVVDKGLAKAKKLFRKRIRNSAEAKTAETRLIGDKDGAGVERADIIIEAIVEKLEVKQGLFQSLEPRIKPDAILASNTSSIPLQDIAAGLKQPNRLVGLHFFNPVAQMPLVEIVYTETTDQAIIDRTSAFATAIKKLPLPTKSAPGFLVNRVLVPYMREALRQYESGVAKEDIDEAALIFGMPVGPVELSDVVGLDIAASVYGVLGGEAPEVLTKLSDAGHLGKKSGQGFYEWKKGKPVKGEVTMAHEDLVLLGEDLVEPMVQEAKRCVAEGIVADADLADAGVIFGTGFAPFLGGPLNYSEKR